MASGKELDVAGGARSRKVIARLVALVCVLSAPLSVSLAQDHPADRTRLTAARAAFEAGQFETAATLAKGPVDQPADLDYVEGLSLSRLARWDEARNAFETGRSKSPQDARFLVELAGLAYKQKELKRAERELRDALRLQPHDEYTRDFLGTIYSLEGNLDAELKYWNAINKPRLRAVVLDPQPQLRAVLLERAVTFNAPQVLTPDALADTDARLQNLGVFPRRRVELAASTSGAYDAALHIVERNGMGDSWLQGLVSLFSGLPYQTVYPEFYNVARDAINFTSLARWDSQKRRYSGSLSMPVFADPALRLRLYFDARDENWNLSQTFLGGGTLLTDLNLRRMAGGAEFRSVVNGRWSWTAGVEVAHRDFRNVGGHTSPAEQPFFSGSNTVASWLGADRILLTLPEYRFTLDSHAEVRGGRSFHEEVGPFAEARGGVRAHWFPRASGDDYEMQSQLRVGATAGKVPFDELFQLGLERDNDLWLRGQPGTTDGRKGAAPLGRRYFLANWEMDKNVYRGAFFGLRVGPFFDNGAIADSSGLFGSRRWLWDAGAQCKIHILGNVTVVLSYGRDLHGGPNVYYGTVLR